MTQRETVLEALRAAGTRGLCISDMGQIDWTAVLTMRNRISELRASGVDIESFPCRIHQHRSSVARYRLAPAGQLELLGTLGDSC